MIASPKSPKPRKPSSSGPRYVFSLVRNIMESEIHTIARRLHIDIDSKTIVDIATGTTSIGTEKTLGTQLVSSTTNYVIVRVTSDGATDEIHGGYVTIAAV